MSGFMEEGNGNIMEGALREKPRLPVRGRNRRAAQADEDGGGGAAPQEKPKQGGWGTEVGAETKTASMGRRAADSKTETAISGVYDSIKPSKDDEEDTLIIPDLEEADQDDLTQVVAEPGMIDQAVLPTNLSADDGKLPPAQVEGLDLSLLYEFLMPMKALEDEFAIPLKKDLTADEQIRFDKEMWDPDLMLNKLKQQMQEEVDAKEAVPAAVDASSKIPIKTK